MEEKCSEDISSQLLLFREKLSLSNAEKSIPGHIEQDDIYCIRFLRAKNMSVEHAIETYRRYHEMRNKNKELFAKMTPSGLRHVLESEIVTKLPGTDNQGRAIFLFRFKMWNTKEISMDEIYLACVLLLEEMSCEESVQKNGIVMIHDYEGFAFSHFRKLTMRNFIRILQIMQGNFPLKFKAFYEINQPSLFYILYNIFYPLVSYKLRKRIFMFGSKTEMLANHFPLTSLPLELGGTLEIFSDHEFVGSLFGKENYYEKLVQQLK